jgi:hypothetical protein
VDWEAHANRQSQSSISNRNPQSPVVNEIANQQSKSAISNRQSVNRQSAIGNRQ